MGCASVLEAAAAVSGMLDTGASTCIRGVAVMDMMGASSDAKAPLEALSRTAVLAECASCSISAASGTTKPTDAVSGAAPSLVTAPSGSVSSSRSRGIRAALHGAQTLLP
eukprot:364495-Chlamydomonas_euryale.AAC.2